MRHSFFKIMFLVFIAMMNGCTKDIISNADSNSANKKYAIEKHKFVSIEEYARSFKVESSRAIEVSGATVLLDQYIYVVEQNKGIHIINNQNPSSPIKVGFLTISDVSEVHAKGNTLYCFNYNRAYLFDISNRSQPVYKKYINNLGFEDPNYKNPYMDSVSVIYERIEVDSATYFAYYSQYGGWGFTGNPLLKDFMGATTLGNVRFNVSSAAGTTNTAKVGSTARIAIKNDHLYFTNGYMLYTYQLNGDLGISQVSKTNLNFNCETLFEYEEYLYMGSPNGMYIYSLSSPSSPYKTGEYRHVRSCDPVVVSGNIAYVTLRNDNDCAQGVNQLEVLDVTNKSAPKLLHVYPLHNPYGLGIDNGILFVCDGSMGLKVFDAKDPHTIDQNLIGHFSAIQIRDVIPHQNVLLSIAKNAIIQYDYSNIKNITKLSEVR